MTNSFQYGDLLIKSGDTVVVHQIIQEGEKKRIQKFEGLVIKIRKGVNGTFTVRKLAKGNIGVERIFPINSVWIEKIELKYPAKARRAKLYYLRAKKTKRDLKFKKDEKRATELKKKNSKAAKKSTEGNNVSSTPSKKAGK